MKKVSIIIPVYNTEKYIEDNIKCLINQTYSNLEIIYIDDGSDDNSGHIIKKYLQKDKRIKYFKSSHQGVSCARNIGIKESAGDYILFQDADDICDRKSVEILLSKIFDADCIVASLYEFGNRKIDYRKVYINAVKEFGEYISRECIAQNMHIFHMIIVGVVGSVSNKLFKADIIRENNLLFDTNLNVGEDLIFGLNYFSYCQKIKIFPESLFGYRRYNTQTTGNSRKIPYFAKNYNMLFDTIERWVLDYSGSVRKLKIDYAIDWLLIIEKAARNVNWFNKDEIKDFMSIKDNSRTRQAYKEYIISKSAMKQLVLFYGIIYKINSKMVYYLYGNVTAIYKKIKIFLYNVIWREL